MFFAQFMLWNHENAWISKNAVMFEKVASRFISVIFLGNVTDNENIYSHKKYVCIAYFPYFHSFGQKMDVL